MKLPRSVLLAVLVCCSVALSQQSGIEQAKREGAANAEQLKMQLNAQRVNVATEMFNQQKQYSPQAVGVGTSDPNVRCKADAPTISGVTRPPVTPGVRFGINGKGLGATPGTVDLMTGGRVFPARVVSWNSCAVVAELGNNIEGVKADKQATLQLKTSAGKEVRASTSFQPCLDVVWEQFYLWCQNRVVPAGCHADKEIFKYTLWNDWYIREVRLMYKEGNAKITSPPRLNQPNVRANTSVHVGAAGYATSSGEFMIFLVGPKGLTPYPGWKP